MNKDNAKDYLPLVQALAAGKVIQIKEAGGGWADCNPTFTINAENYRIKPEPREMWVNHYPGGVMAGHYESKESAYEQRSSHKAVQVLYREVME